jgi:hypothetical protein
MPKYNYERQQHYGFVDTGGQSPLLRPDMTEYDRGCNFEMSWLVRLANDDDLPRINAAATRSADWSKAISSLGPQDEIWYYNSPQRCWSVGMGLDGFVVIRDGEAVHRVVSRFN